MPAPKPSAKRLTLSTRLALSFALLAFIATAGVGVMLNWKLEAQLSVRDDGALVTRVDQLRTLMQDVDAHDLIRDKPHLFANMLGNTESLLVVGYPGEAPLIDVNPGHSPVPTMQPVAADAPLTLAAVRHTTMPDGTPFIYVAAAAHGVTGQRDLQIVSGRLMTERTEMLHDYRRQIVLFALAGAVLAALLAFALARYGLRPLRRLAAQTAAIGVGTLSTRIARHNAPPELDPLVDAFNAMLDRLERGFTQLKQVSADMAHDLRTPIANLLGQTEVGLRQTREPAYYQQLLGSNFEELQRLSKMIDNMLFLARAEHADHVIDRQSVALTEELPRLAEYFEGLAEERGIRLEWQGDAHVLADAQLLRRALANLIVNAIRYADVDTVVRIGAELRDGATALHVESYGPTIDAAHRERLFDRFYRTDAARHQSSGSNGLGLSIVRSIMQLHGGTWAVQSEAGVTRFTLTFPDA